MVDLLKSKIPPHYNSYIEPFFGGGALFFAVRPSNAIIADSNPELINLYQVVKQDVGNLIDALKIFVNTPDEFDRLASIGCHVVLTNSNHPLIVELYGKHQIEIIQTRRNVARKKSEDVVISANLPPVNA